MPYSHRQAVAGLAALIAIAPFPAVAQEAPAIQSVTKADLDSMIEDLNLVVTFETEPEEETPGYRLETEDGFNFIIIGNACADGACKGLKLLAEYSVNDAVTMEALNNINRSVPARKVWLDTERNSWMSERYLILDGGSSMDVIKFEIQTFQAVSEYIAGTFSEN